MAKKLLWLKAIGMQNLIAKSVRQLKGLRSTNDSQHEPLSCSDKRKFLNGRKRKHSWHFEVHLSRDSAEAVGSFMALWRSKLVVFVHNLGNAGSDHPVT